ncbi:MAG: TolC family protein [Runella sp.]
MLTASMYRPSQPLNFRLRWVGTTSHAFYFILFISSFFHSQIFAQRVLTLEEAVEMGRGQSPFYARAQNTYERSYWRYQNFRASLKPQIRLNASVPTFFRAINPITQPDGSIEFRRIQQANNTVGVSMVQNIAATGGQLRMGTGLQRTDNFLAGQQSFFLASPITVSYDQSALLFNELKWRKLIEPTLYEAAQKGYVEDIEEAGLRAVELFFNALTAQTAVGIAQANTANTDSLYRISKERFGIGKLTENELLQLELNLLNVQNQWAEAQVNLEIASQNLKRILGIPIAEVLRFEVNTPVSVLSIVPAQALEEARANRRALIDFKNQRLEADRQIAEAKGANSLTLGVVANVGTQQTAPRLIDSYSNLQSRQYIGLNIDVPLQDWGFRKSQIRLAKANRELVEVNVKQEEINFEQEILLQTLRFNQQQQQVAVAQKADTIAQRRLEITKQRFLLGRISITDLNIALTETAQARQNYIAALRAYWTSYYTLRRLTLYDFLNNQPIRYAAPR